MLVLLVSCSTLRYSADSLKKVQHNIDEYQLITGVLPYLPDETTFEAWTVVSENTAQITLFLPTGQTFCSAKWDGSRYSYESSFVENGHLFGKALLNDLIEVYSNEQIESPITVQGKNYLYTIETLAQNL